MPPRPDGASALCRRLLLASALAAASANLFDDGPVRAREGRIINGDEAEEDRYPYAVTLQDRRRHFCGGSLIGKDVVLTAAHCMLGNPFDVRLGSDDKDVGELIGTRRVAIHPDYDWNTDEWDIAVVFLEESTSLNIPLVKLNGDSSFPSEGTTVVSMGWGDTDKGSANRYPDNLREVELETIANDDCEEAEEDGQTYRGWIYESMICTYTEGKDACKGDSGGPLVVKGDRPEDDVQVGIVSWGVDCAFLPGVFSRVSEAYDWVVEVVCDEDDGSEDPPASLCGEPYLPERTGDPTRRPTRDPTGNPTKHPTRFPTRKPTRNPTNNPTRQPTKKPTRQPTQRPTRQPTKKPTNAPTSSPTTPIPTYSPTEQPAASPSISSAPISSPSSSPTLTSAPTPPPTDSPSLSRAPSDAPSASPTFSSQPSSQPTARPTSGPSAAPTEQPSPSPSSRPSGRPSLSSRPSLSTFPTKSAPPSRRPTPAPSPGPRGPPTGAGPPAAAAAAPAARRPGAGRAAAGRSPRIASDVPAPAAGDGGAGDPSGGTARGLAVGALLCGFASAAAAL